MKHIKDLIYNTEVGQPKAKIELFKENDNSFFVRLSLRCTQMDELTVIEFLKADKPAIQTAYCNYQEKAYDHASIFGYPQIETVKG